MAESVPRLRVFAGPNGSGKSTIKQDLPPEWLGVYINADDIEKFIREHGFLSLADYQVTATGPELKNFLAASTLLAKAGLLDQAAQLVLSGDKFETVMSHPDKVEFLHKAQQAGFRTYLYYVATKDPEINVFRVQHRVATGGHPVSEKDIVSRYSRSLNLLSDAVAFTDRAYIFDNSGHERVWIAEVTGGNELRLEAEEIPFWVKTALLDKFGMDFD